LNSSIVSYRIVLFFISALISFICLIKSLEATNKSGVWTRVDHVAHGLLLWNCLFDRVHSQYFTPNQSLQSNPVWTTIASHEYILDRSGTPWRVQKEMASFRDWSVLLWG